MKPFRKHRPTLPISSKQIGVIQLACNQFGISKEERSEMLFERFKVTSTADLTMDQASALIKEFEKKGFAIIPKKGSQRRPSTPPRPEIPRKKGNIVALATRDELEKIDQVAALIEWREENGLALFLEKRMGIKGGKVRTSAEAYLAIEGLKKMFENGMKKKYGSSWWIMPYCNPGIMDYIRLHCPLEWRR